MKTQNKSYSMLEFALSLIVDQLFAVFASFIIINIIDFFLPNGGKILSFILCVFIYAALVYSNAWSVGCSDYNRVRLNIIKDNRAKGFIAGAIAAAPAFVLALLAYLAETNVASFSDFLSVDICSALNRLWQIPLNVFFEYVNKMPVLNFVLPLFLPFVAGVSYILGINEISVKSIILYKKNDK